MATSTSLDVHVLLRYSKKTGKIDTTLTGLGCAMLKMWALQHCPKTKEIVVMHRDTGKVVFVVTGTADGYPFAKSDKREYLGTCEDFGVALEDLQNIKDDRFDS